MNKKKLVKKEKEVKQTETSDKKGPKKVLIIDDHVTTAIDISTMLDFAGFRTFQAYNKKDAIQIAKIRNPDLIILNPVIDGVACPDFVDMFSDTKFIILRFIDSKKVIPDNKKNVLGFLTKPVDKDALFEIIDDKI